MKITRVLKANIRELPEQQQTALKQAIKWQIFTICFTLVTITVMAFVMGNSMAMRTAWIEDMLSLLPQISFLIALFFTYKQPTLRHPYGWHRAMGVGHLVSGVALLTVGTHLGYEAAKGLVTADHPTIGTVQLFGNTVWLGWLMVIVMALIVVGPLWIYGPPKKRLAPILHNKVLSADADMAKADWQTNAASIIGVLGVGVGFWWLDGAAAVFISIGIILDGYKNTKMALADLMDQRARTSDSAKPHPVREEIATCARERMWVGDVGMRIRDEGQLLQVELFVVPRLKRVNVDELTELQQAICDLAWNLHDVVVIPTSQIPEWADRGLPFPHPSATKSPPKKHHKKG